MELKFQNLSGHGAMTYDVPEEDKIVGYQWRMLQDNPVPGLLPLSCIHRDNRVMLSWRITSLQPLSLLFERRCWTVPDMMHLIRQLYRIIFRMEDLLLDEERLLLDNRYLMVDPVTMELHLAYVPLAIKAGCNNPEENPIRQLLQQWVMGDCRLSGDESRGLAELVTLLNDPSFHWSRLESVCREVRLQECQPETGMMPMTNDSVLSMSISDQKTSKSKMHLPVPEGISVNAWSSTLKTVEANGKTETSQKMEAKSKMESDGKLESDRKLVADRNLETVGNMVANGKTESNRNAMPDRKKETLQGRNPYGSRMEMSIRLPWKEGLPPNRQESGAMVKTGIIRIIALQVLVSVIVAGAVFGGVLREKGPDSITAWVGMVLVITALEAFAFYRRPKDKSLDKVGISGPSASLRDYPVSKRQGKAPFSIPSDIKENILSEHSQFTKSAGDLADGQPIGPIEAENIGIAALKTMNHTQLLPEENGRHLQVRCQNGRTARIDLYKTPFLLGRFRDQVDGYLEHPSVGKIHAEIRETEKGLCLVDLNSRNGTHLNGTRIDPYLEMPLSIGDVIKLANEELVFAHDGGHDSASM